MTEDWRKKYNAVSYFNDGFAKVQFNDKCGFVNEQGEKVISSKYDLVWDFNDDLAIVQLNGKFGFVNKIGKEVVPLKYDWVGDFHGDFAKVQLNGKCGFVNKIGKEYVDILDTKDKSQKRDMAVALKKDNLQILWDESDRKRIEAIIDARAAIIDSRWEERLIILWEEGELDEPVMTDEEIERIDQEIWRRDWINVFYFGKYRYYDVLGDR